MDVFLYRLNISGLTISVLLIAMFFTVLSRLIPRAEMRWWTYGWFAHVGAMAVTSAFWYVQPPVAVHGLVFAAYLFPKAVYVWLLLRGALEFGAIRPNWLRPSVVLPALLTVCTITILVITTRDRLGLATSILLLLGFGAGAIALARTSSVAAAWVGVGFALRALHAAMEGAAYAFNLTSTGQGDSAFAVPANTLLAAHYALAIGAEWLLAMGCVIGVSARTQRELQLANTQLLDAQASLRRLVDRDPLTALANRRALPGLLRQVQPHGAFFIFFDLDGFKRINDQHGHQTGDRCLVDFAAALTQSFRPTDAIVRYAGDEFLVVARGLDESSVQDRVEAVRVRAAHATVPIRFSCGIGRLARGGNPETALRAADDAMYRAKSERVASRTAASNLRHQTPKLS